QDALRELNTDLEARVRRRTGQLELARTEAEQASEAKSTFLATMSHEIRTPMNGLLGLLELLSLGSLDPSQQAALKVARKSGADLQHIIDDILDFSKMEAGSVRLNPVAACVDDVVRSVCRLHSQAAAGKGLELSVHVAPQVSPLLMFDPLRLGQILNNFTNNAIKFTESGKVDVVVELAGSGAGTQELRFLVRDTGIGISPAQLGRLFQPFAQGTDQTTSHYGGTGLGLVISRSLAELMGGSVEVQSEPGQGTVMKLCVTFAVCDAATQAPAAAGTGAQSPQPPAAGRPAPSIQEAEADGTLLLVVDDHPVNLMVLRQQLASLGYAAEGVADGVEALAAWKSGRFGAVITDCNMPRINGYELAAAIRKLELRKGGRRTPIIACTANALPAATALCISAGMDDCLVKPVTLADISRMLDQWLPIGLLNLALLAQVSGGDAAAAAAVVADFRAANQHDSAQLRQAAASADFSGVANFSHRIKGACLMMGATALAAACGRVEDAGTAADAHAVQSALEGFEAQLLRLDSHLARQPAPHGLF
ncbi:MAG: ATP-binding protein, partial [Ramlibacter sp.]